MVSVFFSFRQPVLSIRRWRCELGLGSFAPVSLAETRERRGPTTGPQRRRPARREAPHPGHAELRGSRRARGGTGAGRMANSDIRPRVDVDLRAVCPPAYREGPGIRGHERRRAGDPHSHLAREGGDRPAAAQAHPRGAGMGRGDGVSDRQPVRPDRPGARFAGGCRAAHAARIPQET